MKDKYCCRIFLLVVFLLIPGPLLAQDLYELTLQANASALEFIAEAVVVELPPSRVSVGTNILYDEDEYTVFGLQGMVGNAVQFEALTGKIGFKGVVGDFEHQIKDSQLLGLAFSAGGEYDLSNVVDSYYIPVILSATLNVGPEPLCFEDTEEYIEAIAAVDWKVLENGAITASYRYLEVDFDEPIKWQKTDRAVYLGLKFTF